MLCIVYCGCMCGSKRRFKRGGGCLHSWTHLRTKQRVGTPKNASKNDNEPPEHCARGLRFHFPVSPPHFTVPLLTLFLTSPSFVSSFLSLVHSVIPRTKGTVAGLAGHTNHRQKIHLLDKVMKENRALKKENAVLQTKVVHTRRPAGGAGKKD